MAWGLEMRKMERNGLLGARSENWVPRIAIVQRLRNVHGSARLSPCAGAQGKANLPARPLDWHGNCQQRWVDRIISL